MRGSLYRVTWNSLSTREIRVESLVQQVRSCMAKKDSGKWQHTQAFYTSLLHFEPNLLKVHSISSCLGFWIKTTALNLISNTAITHFLHITLESGCVSPLSLTLSAIVAVISLKTCCLINWKRIISPPKCWEQSCCFYPTSKRNGNLQILHLWLRYYHMN